MVIRARLIFDAVERMLGRREVEGVSGGFTRLRVVLVLGLRGVLVLWQIWCCLGRSLPRRDNRGTNGLTLKTDPDHTLTDSSLMQYDKSTRGRSTVCPKILLVTCTMLLGLASVSAGQSTDSQATDSQATDSQDLAPQTEAKPITLVQPGTKVVNASDAELWNRLVLVASPKINSGDLDVLSDSVRDAATACSLTIMATVAPELDAAGRAQRFQLRHVGVGYSAAGSAGSVVVSSATASELGVSLGFISRQVLRTNESQLAEVKVIAATSQLVVFDAPSVMYRRGTNRKYLTRHLVYVDSQSGQGATMSWLLVPPSNDELSMSIINQPIRVTPWGTKETRRVHVDGEAFNFLGIPGELAFGLEDLPPGEDVRWTKRAARVAGRKAFSKSEAQELFDALHQALASEQAKRQG